MSIINRVLKDLESRDSAFIPIEVAAVGGPELNDARAPWLIPVVIIAVLMVVGVGGMRLLDGSELFSEPPDSLPVIEVPLKPGPLVTDVVKVIPELLQNQIIGLQIQESDSLIRLEFSLANRVVAYVKERSNQRFVYHLKDITSEILAPKIQDSRWIKRLQLVSRNEGVDIDFETEAAVLVETGQSQNGDDYIWSIEIREIAERPAIEGPVVSEPVTPIAVNQVQGNAVKTEVPVEVEVVKPKPKVKLEISSSRKSNESLELQRAAELIRKKRWNQAEGLLQSLLNGEEDKEARRHLITIYDRSKQTEKFSQLINESMALYPQAHHFVSAYARSLYQLGSYQSAIDQLLETADTNADQLSIIAASYQRLDLYSKAIEYYRASLKLKPRQVRNWVGLGISLEHVSELKEALNAYRAAAKLGHLSVRLSEFVDKRSRALEKVIN
ncbi:MAG: tetratricopeptide (TPR) repeat protein [Gammaproteobacteria bacterium]|jgi:tetratricopeptide (TPR) repeat protein